MKIARLKALRINAPLRRGESYHDDGFVGSIKIYTRELCSRYPFKENLKNETYLRRDHRPLDGCYLPMTTPHGTEYHIFYIDHRHEPTNLFMRAHEETHVLYELGRLDILADRLLAGQGVRISFDEIDEEEVIAELGGIYALGRAGLRPGSIMRRHKTGRYFGRAMRLYEQSRLQ